MIYFKTMNDDGSVSPGSCGKYIPTNSVEITKEEFEELVSEFKSREPDPEQAVVDSIMQEVSSYGY